MAKTRKIIRFFIVFFIIAGWTFSPFPRVLNFPPEIKQAKAATTVSTAALANSTQYSNGRKLFRDSNDNRLAVFINTSSVIQVAYCNSGCSSWTTDSGTIGTAVSNVQAVHDTTNNKLLLAYQATVSNRQSIVYAEATIVYSGNDISDITFAGDNTLAAGASNNENYRPGIVLTHNNKPGVVFTKTTAGPTSASGVYYIRCIGTCTGAASSNWGGVSATSGDGTIDTIYDSQAKSKNFIASVEQMPGAGTAAKRLYLFFSEVDDPLKYVVANCVNSCGDTPPTWTWQSVTSKDGETVSATSYLYVNSLADSTNSRVLVTWFSNGSTFCSGASAYCLNTWFIDKDGGTSASTKRSSDSTTEGNVNAQPTLTFYAGSTPDYYALFTKNSSGNIVRQFIEAPGSTATDWVASTDWDSGATINSGTGNSWPNAKVDDAGSQWDMIFMSAANTLTHESGTISPPNAPTQDSPADAATGVSVTPTFLVTATDPNSSNINYKITIYSESSCTTVLQTHDEADAWELRLSGTNSWFGVGSDSDGSNLIAGQNAGRLYTSDDYGATWDERQPAGALNKEWRAIDSDSDGSNLIAGASTADRLYTSSDGGANWDERQPDGNNTRYWRGAGSDADGSVLIAGVFDAATTGELWFSTDSGANWGAAAGVGSPNDWRHSAADSDGSVLLGAEGVGLWSSIDSGQNWVSELSGNFWGAALDDDGTFMVGSINGGALWMSSSTGSTWSYAQSTGKNGLLSKSWQGVDADSDGSFLIAGETTRLWTSWDSGENWYERRPAGDTNLSWWGVATDSDGTNLIAGVNGGALYTYENTWSGTNAVCTNEPAQCFTSGTQGSYTLNSDDALSNSTQYWWKASARDPDDTNAYTDSGCSTFTTEAVEAPTTATNLTQIAYRWFANDDSTDVGGAGGYNTPIIAPESGTPIRLRLLFDVGGDNDLTSTTSRLQVGEKPGGGCSSASFSDVGGTTAMTWADNFTPSDGAALTANYQDPRYAATSTSHAVVNQTYNESNNFTSSQGTVDAGASMLFDFALSVSTTSLDTVAKGGKTFCLQAVQSGGGSFAQEGGGGYTTYPEISIEKPEILRLRGHVRLRNVRLR
ncbi:MAG: hypothetical protein HYT03_01950 [Candidatus Harrisonbacteria bacterium]|nr:hypothetical protein [Candidatus Harrisonbacteria bacterium]